MLMPCSPDENHVVSLQYCNISHNENATSYSSPGIIWLEGFVIVPHFIKKRAGI